MQNLTQTKINYSAVNKKFKGSFDTLITTYVLKNLNDEKLTFRNFIKDVECKVILTTLKLTGGNQRKAASILGIKATTLNEKFKRYELGKIQREIDPAIILNKSNVNLLN